MRRTLLLLLTVVLASGCLLDRTGTGAFVSDGGLPDGDAGSLDGGDCSAEICNGVDDDCDGLEDEGLEPVCNAAGDALEGCAMGADARTDCMLGCTPGESFCWDCDPSDTTGTCNSAGVALEGCGPDGRENIDTCLNGCTPGETACAPCTTGTTACDGDELVTCVAAVEQRETCDYACLDAATPATCSACTPGESECHGTGAGSIAVQCAANGSISSSETCTIDCSVVGGVAACFECTPSTTRCNAAATAVLSCGADGRETSTNCAGSTTCVESGSGATCVDVCVPGCAGGVVTSCPSRDTVSCPLGCNTAMDDCALLRPSNVGTAIAMDAGTTDLSVGDSGAEVLVFFSETGRIVRVNPSTLTFDANVRGEGDFGGDNGSGIFFDQVSQGGDNPDLGVWAVRSLTVAAGSAVLFVSEDKDHPVAVLLVEGDATIAGVVSASGVTLPVVRELYIGAGASPGGELGADGFGTGGGGDGSGADGGGGGGFGSAGGPDGSGTGTGGASYGNASLVPLLAGSGGGGTENGDARGGSGGGAIQISAGGAMTIAATGVVGSAGRPGHGATGHGGGGGGGSGGAVLLEAATIDILGIVGAPGGGGGGGRHNGDPSSDGVDWDPLAGSLRCLGGASSAGGGGNGADGSDLAGAVGTAGSENSDDGGGGGGAGRIRLNALTVGDVTVTGADRLTPSFASSLASRGTVGLR